jgi:TM2 domain-containing membrane protein YozV
MGGVVHGWDMEVNVLASEKPVAILLSRENATAVASAALPPGATVITPSPSQPSQTPIARYPTSLGPTDVGYRDPNLALLFGLLLTGGGHMYSGEVGKGVGILLGTATLVGVAVSFCNYNSCEETYAAAALVGALGLIVYGWVDAPAAAKRTNRKGVRNLSFGPLQLRTTAQGLAVSIPLP